MDVVVNLDCIDQKNLSSLIYRLTKGGGHKNQAITKAVGTSNKKKLQVIDATCGFGTDSIVLAYFNCQVYAIERHPKIATLLTKRLEQAKKHPLLATSIANIQLFTGNCIEVIPKLIKEYQFIPDVIYLDPMFNQKTSAAPNKFIQILQYIITNEPISTENHNINNFNANNLLTSILNLPIKRIVVKRPRFAPYLENFPANFSLIGKSNRFDVYLKELTFKNH